MNIFGLSPSKRSRAGKSGGLEAGGGVAPVDERAVETALIERCQQGDLRAYDELVTAHRDKIYAMINKMVRNEADAWDLSQDVFVKAWKALPRFEARAKFSTWLFRIAHNTVYDFTRKRKNRHTDELDEGLLDRERIAGGAATAPAANVRPDKALERNELREKIEAALGKLSEKHRECIVLREIEGLDYKEIAEVMECSIGTVMSRLYYARKKLQEDLTER